MNTDNPNKNTGTGLGCIGYIIYSLVVTFFPLNIICSHYGIDGIPYWILLVIYFGISFYLERLYTIISPILMIWGLILLGFKTTPLAILYYIVFIVFCCNYYILIRGNNANSGFKKSPQRRNPGDYLGYIIVFAFVFAIIMIIAASYNGKKTNFTQSTPSPVVTDSPTYSVTPTPITNTYTPTPTQKPKSYHFKNINTMYKKVQRFPKKYNNSIISVSGYASFIGYSGNEGNSFVLTKKKHDDDIVAWFDFEEIYEKNDCLYVEEYSLDSFSRVLNKDKVSVKGIIHTEYDPERKDYISIMNNPMSIKIK